MMAAFFAVKASEIGGNEVMLVKADENQGKRRF